MLAKRLLTALVVVMLSVTSGACYSVKYATNKRPQAAEYQVKNHFFLAGLVGHSRVNLSARCPDGVATVEVVHTALDMLLSGVTFGFWSPTTTKYRCAEGGGQATVPVEESNLANAAGEGRR